MSRRHTPSAGDARTVVAPPSPEPIPERRPADAATERRPADAATERPLLAVSEHPLAGVAEPSLEEPVRPVVPGTEWLVRRVHPQLQKMWDRGFRFLFVLDAVALYGSMVLINLVRFGFSWPTYPLSHYAVGFAIATAIHLTVGYFAGLYEREPRLGVRPWLPRVMLAVLIGVGVEGVAFVALDRYLMPRLNLAALVVVASCAMTGNRRLSRFLARRRQGPPRVVLVGPDDATGLAERHLAVSDRDARVVATTPTTDDLAGVVTRHDATDVLLLAGSSYGHVFPEPLSTLEARDVGFLQRVGAEETLLGLRSVREVAGMPFVRLRTHTLPSYKYRLKRIVDLVITVAALPLVLPILAGTALLVLVRAGRPVLYRQERLGRDGVPFTMVKFRTMRRDAEAAGAQLATGKDDQRVVPGLRFLRSTRLDELPQVFHVLAGTMSLVGPRPERPEFTGELALMVPGYERRLEIAPGLTGLAQVQGRYDTDASYKLGYDLQYLVNWSPVLDVQILARTLWVVLSRRV